MNDAMPIAWHEECLRNREASLELAERQARNAAAVAEGLRATNAFYRNQIETAKSAGRTEFDADRYLIKRRAR